MKSWRTWLLLILLIGPLTVLVLLGAWSLWDSGLLTSTWWILPICWGTAYLLARRWSRTSLRQASAAPLESPRHWSPRDEAAAQLVAEHEQAVLELDSQQLTDPRFYLESALELATRVSQHYHPKAADPLDALTVVEMLSAAHLAVEELEQWVRETVPGSHLLTVAQWKKLAKAPRWYRTVRNLTWAVSSLVNPINAARFLTSRLTMDPLAQHLQTNLLAAFYVAYLRQVGHYLIELNSGRLRGGSRAYRELQQQLQQQPGDKSAAEPCARGETARGDQAAGPAPPDVRIAVVGQVKSGKSSLINALLGERQARTDVLPATQSVTRHRWCPQEGSSDVVLLDTPGYGDAELTEQQLGELYQAFQQADVVLLTLKATHPARKPDVTLLKVMSQRFAAEPRYRPPAVLGVLTHIDGLRPVMEWSPPYDWSNPQRPKEHSLYEALVWNQQQFETALQTIVPVCLDETAAGGVYGVQEWLVPTLCTTLDDAHARALLRGLHDGIADRRLQELLVQCRTAAGQLLDAFIQSTSG